MVMGTDGPKLFSLTLMEQLYQSRLLLEDQKASGSCLVFRKGQRIPTEGIVRHVLCHFSVFFFLSLRKSHSFFEPVFSHPRISALLVKDQME